MVFELAEERRVGIFLELRLRGLSPEAPSTLALDRCALVALVGGDGVLNLDRQSSKADGYVSGSSGGSVRQLDTDGTASIGRDPIQRSYGIADGGWRVSFLVRELPVVGWHD